MSKKQKVFMLVVGDEGECKYGKFHSQVTNTWEDLITYLSE